jgi:hypothetical protein
MLSSYTECDDICSSFEPYVVCSLTQNSELHLAKG